MLLQYVFEKLLERVIKERVDMPDSSKVLEGLTEIEYNALRYAAGFFLEKTIASIQEQLSLLFR